METTSAKEYRARQRKTITLPSGFVFEIRKMSPLVFTKMFDLIGVTGSDSSEVAKKKVQEGLQKILELVIPRCVIKPKISLEPAGEDELSLDDLEMDDFLMLLEEITTFSGLSEGSIEERESFLEK